LHRAVRLHCDPAAAELRGRHRHRRATASKQFDLVDLVGIEGRLDLVDIGLAKTVQAVPGRQPDIAFPVFKNN